MELVIVMGWFLGLSGLTQDYENRPLLDGLDGLGTQGPAIDMTFNMDSSKQRKFYNFLRRIAYDFWIADKKYAAADGPTGDGGQPIPISYGPEKVKEKRPPPTPPVAPTAPPAGAGAGLPGYVLDNCRRARNYINELFPDAQPAYACA